MRQSIFFLFIFALLSCRATVNPSEWVVSTATCWNTMTVSRAGSVIPRTLTACDRVIILPATAMAAEFEAETKFAGRVAGKVVITYQWTIEDPILFIQNAKGITSSYTSSDHKIDPEVLEGIENSVVDKMLIDVLRSITPNMEPGIDESHLELVLQEQSGEIKKRGVTFSNMSVNINFSPQTEEALDVLSALRFYSQNGEEELGRQVILKKAGSANITTTSKAE